MSLDENKAIVRRWVEQVINNKQMEVADEVLSPELRSETGSRKHLKDLIAYLHKVFPDLHQSIDALIAEGDTVVEQWTNHATHTGGEYAGVPPTGKHLEGRGVDIYRIVDGKIVEHRGVFNQLPLWQELGYTFVPPQPKT
jgi:predicted ester cyclase